MTSSSEGSFPKESAKTRALQLAKASLPAVLLVLLNVAFRFPHLLNAGNVHADSAIIGLQADHFLRGEFTWFIWGAGYQGVLDILFIAPAFAIFGRGPLVLMAVPLFLHIVASLLTFDILRRRISPWRAFIVCLVLVFTPQAINGVALYVPRQACITAVFAAVWFFDRASSWRWQPVGYALGSLMVILALYADLYALQMIAGVLLFAFLCFWDGAAKWRTALWRFASMALSLALGAGLLWWVRTKGPGGGSPTSLRWERIGQNFDLLWDHCLGWALGYKIYQPFIRASPTLWVPPEWFAIFQKVAAVIFVTAIVSAAALFFWRRLPWEIRRLGVLGLCCAGASFAGFLVSTMPVDTWSARYLAPIVWMAPFALAPLIFFVNWRGATVLLAPYLVSAAVGGWVSFAGSVDGFLPAKDPRGQATEEYQLGELLRQKGVTGGAAQYWLAYRLTYLWDEKPTIVPLWAGQDRYLPYRRVAQESNPYAVIFHPMEPYPTPGPFEQQLRMTQTPHEKLVVGEFTAFVVRQR